MGLPLLYLLVPATAAVLSYVLGWAAIAMGRRLNLVDEPGGRRKHRGRVVRIGGLGLYPAFVVATLLTLGLPRNDPLELTRLIGVLLALGVVWLVGLLDDCYRLSALAQGAGLVVAAAVAIACKVFIEVFNSPFTDAQIWVAWWLMVPITVIWLVGMSTTVNMLDGLDGLAAGVTGLAALVLFVHMVRLGQHSVSLLPLALAGCCLGILPHNYNPARLFLGGGAYVLGFALGALAIVAGAKVATVLLVVWLPIVDVAWQIYARHRRGQPVNLGDRGHLHFRLLDVGWSARRVVLLYYAVTALLGSVALLVSSRLLKLGILAGVGLLAALGLALLTRATGDRTETGN